MMHLLFWILNSEFWIHYFPHGFAITFPSRRRCSRNCHQFERAPGTGCLLTVKHGGKLTTFDRSIPASGVIGGEHALEIVTPVS